MVWIVLIFVIAIIAWAVGVASGGERKRQMDAYIANRGQSDDRSRMAHAIKSASPGAITITVETIQRSKERTPQEEEAYQKAKEVDWNWRMENRAVWSGDTTTKLPINALTRNQYFCLRDAIMKYRIRADADFIEVKTIEERVKYHQLRTLNSMLKHGMLAKSDAGDYTVTDLGCRAFEMLPMRYN